MFNKSLMGSSVVAALTLAAPSFAQSQIDNNQPVQGSLHSREVAIQNNLNASFAAGVISSTQLAELQRDLDGILVKEERQRTKAGGQTDSNFESISKALDCFEGKIGRHSSKVAASPVVVPVGGVITPITGNQSSVIQPTQPTYMVPAATIAVPATTTQTTVDVPTGTVTRTTTTQSVAAPASTIVLPAR